MSAEPSSSNPQESPIDYLSQPRYKERVALIKYSITFSGAAVAFLVSAKTQLGLQISSDLLRMTLLAWGITIVSGLLQYVFSYREAGYHQRLPMGLRKKIIPKLELIVLYVVLFIHPVAMVLGLILTVIGLWNAFPANSQ